MNSSRPDTIFLSGICGSGMRPLALVAARQGYHVKGTDSGWKEDAEFKAAGIRGGSEPDPAEAAAADIYVYSSAIAADHPERIAGQSGEARVFHRMQLLNLLVESADVQFALAGTHGKTSSTSMAGWLLLQMGLDPTILAGGRPLFLPEGCRNGAGDTAVYETDESDGSFLLTRARHRLILNVDRDHLNHYGSFETLAKAFETFAFAGRPVLYSADPVLSAIARSLAKNGPPVEGGRELPVLFGLEENMDRNSYPGLSYYAARFGEGDDLTFRLVKGGDSIRAESVPAHHLHLTLPGRHFAMNALGVLALVHSSIREEPLLSRRFDPEDPGTLKAFAEIMNAFPGVERRLQRIGEVGGISVYDDYGHHPTEIRAVIDALGRRGERPLRVVFQPHRYTRTRELAAEFAGSLAGADEVYLLPLYSAGEDPIPGISSDSIASLMGGRAQLIDPGDFAFLFEKGDPRGAVLFLGAGSVSVLARQFLADRSQRE